MSSSLRRSVSGRWLVAVMSYAGALAAHAQYQPFDPTEASSPTPAVRRAQPVERALPVDASPSPAAKRRDRRTAPTASPSATPARSAYPAPGGNNGPAEPVDPTATAAAPAASAAPTDGAPAPATAVATPAPAPRAAARSARARGGTPAATEPGDTTPPTDDAPNDDTADDIRLAPQKGKSLPPDEVQFNLANALYVRKNYPQAAAEYERYLGQFPEGKQRQAAMWWLGESYRLLKRIPAARSSYQNLTVAFQEGEFVGPATFRLATIDYDDKDYNTALGLFRRAAALAKGQDVRLYSRYSEALCLEQLGRRDETREVYDEIINAPGDNPYRDAARLASANLAVSQKRFNEAFKQYEGLSREAAKPELQAESSLKAGILANDLDQKDTALALFKRATELPGATSQVRADAMIAQLHVLYDTNKYQQLLDLYPTLRPALPDSLGPEAMLMDANAQRQLGRHREARAAYDELITQYSRTPQAAEARYQRIVSLYAGDDPNFVKEADDYVVLATDPVKADQVRLMKADTLFRQRDYVAAAQAYATLDATTLSPKYRAEAAYRLGFCYSQARKPEQTVTAFNRFLRLFPESPLAAKALVLRGAAYQQMKRYPSALADFTAVINDHKDAKEREGALAQKALILGAQNDSRGLIEAFHALVKDYPSSEVVPLAHYSVANAAFNDLKDYALARDEFDAARKASPKDYGQKCSLMVIFCEYQLKDKARLATDIAGYEKTAPTTPVPPTILRWLGGEEFDDKDYAAAEGHLSAAVAAQGTNAPETWLQLARARIAQSKWDGAFEAVQHYLQTVAADPGARALGLLVQGEAQVSMKRYEDAQKTVDEILQLQQEGTLNAKGLLLRGKLEAAQGKYAQAAKSYMSVSVLYDDNELTPQALRLAAAAFEKAGETGEATKAQEELKNRFPGFAAANKAL